MILKSVLSDKSIIDIIFLISFKFKKEIYFPLIISQISKDSHRLIEH